MPRIRLTDAGVAKLPSDPTRDTLYWDDKLRGFGVRVTSKGVRSFVVQFRPKDRSGERRVTLGRYGVLSLSQARDRARIELGHVANNLNPVEEREAAKREARQAIKMLTLWTEYLAEAEGKRAPSTLREYKRLWEKRVGPAFAKRPVREVTPAEVADFQYSMRKTPVSANRALALLGTLFKYAARRHVVAYSSRPTLGMEKYPEEGRSQALEDDQTARLAAVLDRAESEGIPAAPKMRRRPPSDTRKRRHTPHRVIFPADPFKVNAIRLLLLTGWRPGEVRALRWASLDLKAGSLTLRKSKTGRQVRPIGEAACAFLRSLPRVQGSPYVFPGVTPDKPLGDLKRLWANVCAAAELPVGVRPYDLRHTNITRGVEKHGVAVMQQVVGHKSIQTTMIYTHLGGDPAKRAADAVSGDFAARLRRSGT